MLSLLPTTHCSTKLPEGNTATHASAVPQSIHTLLFTPSSEVPISLTLFLMTSFHSIRGRLVFCSVPDGWQRGTIFGNLTSFIRKRCPSHLNISFFITLRSGMEPYFLFCDIPAVKRVPRTLCRELLLSTFKQILLSLSKQPRFRQGFNFL